MQLTVKVTGLQASKKNVQSKDENGATINTQVDTVNVSMQSDTATINLRNVDPADASSLTFGKSVTITI